LPFFIIIIFMRKEYVFLVYRWVKSFQNSGSIFSQKIHLICDATFYGKRKDKLGTLVFMDSITAYAGTIRTASRFTSGHSAGVDSDS
ncbi:hypothetical protein, partial [Aliarcobacter butzleri]|uniref:hypothetical protein n=1 Tax=Aliarcobacter butzleri TaxID=28197 RepID=UPI002B245DE8